MVAIAAADGGTAHFMGAFGGGKKTAHVASESGPPVYLDIPEIMVDLKSDGRRARFLKIVVTLKLPNAETSQYLNW